MALSVIHAFLLVALTFTASSAIASKHQHQHQHQHHHHHQMCSEPSDLEDQWNSLHSNQGQGQMHETFYIMPFLREAAISHTARYNFNMTLMKRNTVFNGSSDCPEKSKKKGGRDGLLPEGDPCPVYYTLNTDPNRYPQVLLEAQCKCQRCQGLVPAKNMQFSRASCEGVYHHVRVLRRLPTCVHNVHQYAQAWEKVQVGCACRLGFLRK